MRLSEVAGDEERYKKRLFLRLQQELAEHDLSCKPFGSGLMVESADAEKHFLVSIKNWWVVCVSWDDITHSFSARDDLDDVVEGCVSWMVFRSQNGHS